LKKLVTLSVVLANAAIVLIACNANTGGGTEAPASIFTTWSVPVLSVGGHAATNVVLTLNSNGTFSETFQAGGPNSLSGTFSPAQLPADTTVTFHIDASSGPHTAPIGTTELLKYTNLTATTVEFSFDSGSGFEGPFRLYSSSALSGASMGAVEAGSAFDFSTGTVDTSGLLGDFQYLVPGITGLVAPSGISWWMSDGFSGFQNWEGNPSYLPPAQGWTPESSMSGTPGIGVRWVKAAEGRYAMIYSASADSTAFGFFYVYPYGSYIWSDHVAPQPTSLTSVVDPGTGGKLIVSWLQSSSPDVVGYVLTYSSALTGREARLGNVLNTTLTGLTDGQQYDVVVQACDGEGNRSDPSAVLSATPH
jgi:hypothetical protein